MENRNRESEILHPSDVSGSSRREFLRLTGLAAAVAACTQELPRVEGKPDAGRRGDGGVLDGGQPAVCATPERQTQFAPQLTDFDENRIEGGKITVSFTVPEFDRECQAPLSVELYANLWGPNPHGGPDSLLAQNQLIGEFPDPRKRNENGITAAGSHSIEGIIPPPYTTVTQYYLVVRDAKNRHSTTGVVTIR